MTELDSKGWYNGFCWRERNRKLDHYKRKLKRREVAEPSGCCAICGDPDAELEYHDEDCSEPYIWTEPAAYGLCRHCHVHKLHKRFVSPSRWFAFLAHVRRGGYTRDLRDDSNVKKEVQDYQRAIECGAPFPLRPLRPYTRTVGEEWFARLTMDPKSLTMRQLPRD